MRATTRIGQIATWGALIGSLALAFAFVALRGTTPSDGARIAFYGDAWSAEGVRIASIDTPAPGLQDGDLITAVDGRSLDDWLAVATEPAAPRPDIASPIPYAIVRDGIAMSTDVTWGPQPLGATLLAGWSVILFSIAVAGVAAFVYAKRPDEPAALALMIAACGAAGSSVPWFLGVTVSGVVQGWPFVLFALLTGPLYMLLWPAGVHLAVVFPVQASAVRRRRWLIPAIYGAALAAYAAALVAAAAATTSPLAWVATWPAVQTVVIVPALGASLAMFIRSYRATRDPGDRTRLRWAWLGLVASAVIGLVGYMIPVLLTGATLLPESWIGLTAMPMPLGLAAGILRGHLFDIDVVVRRAFVYGGLTLGVIASYVAVASLITALVGTEHGFGVSLLATGVAALIALPLRDALQRGVTRMLYGERDQPWLALRRLGQRLELAADPDRVFPVIVETVADALRAPYVHLLVADEDGRLRSAAERGARSGPVIAIPIIDGAVRVGTLELGVRSGEEGFRSDEQELLGDLAREAGAAIRAQRLQADLARSHERLLLAREEERRRLRRDLHDGLGPSLAAIGMRAEASAEMLDADPATARRLLDELGRDVQTALADIRRLVEGLRPPAIDEVGLVEAIRRQAERLDGPSGSGSATAVSVTSDPASMPPLPAAVEVAAYRIAVEAMTNAIRHAEARTCRVHLTAGEDLVIDVTDDGRGLPPGVTPGTGLESMTARATELGGALRIERRRRGGTHLVARLPVSAGAARSAVAPTLDVPADGVAASDRPANA